MSSANTSEQAHQAEKSYFENGERAPYELGCLLQKLSPDFFQGRTASHEQRLIAEAAICHAANANEVLLDGLEALGKTIFIAGNNEEWKLNRHDLCSLGSLIQFMAIEMQRLRDVAGDLKQVKKEYAGRNDAKKK